MEKIAASIAQIAAEAVLKAGGDIQADTRLPADLSPPVLDGLAAWIADQPEPKPSMRDAIRMGLTEWLAAGGYMRPPTGPEAK